MTDSQTTSTDATEAPDATLTEAQEAVGKLLRETREKAGLDIADVARVLRISQKYLEALEDGRNADLPGATYAIGFVRSYAEHLHLDGEEIVRRYKAQAEGVSAKTNLVFPKPIPDSGVPGAAVLGLGVIVAAVAYGAWYYNSLQGDVAMDRVEPVPEHMAVQEEPAAPAAVAPVAQDAEVTEQTPSVPEPDVPEAEDVADMAESAQQAAAEMPEKIEAVQEDEAVAMGETEQVVEGAVSGAAATDTMAAETEAAHQAEPAADNMAAAQPEAHQAEAMAEAGQEAPAAQATDATAADVAATAETASTEPTDMASPAVDGPSRITVRAKSNSWIQVRDETLDRLLFTRLLREGDEYEVPNRPGLHLMTGNAGALELVVDGKPIPAIGAVGEVRRDVELDPDKLKSGTAVAE